MAGLRDAPATELRPVESTRPHVLAVDLGTGGPKVAVLAAIGRIAAHAFQAVGIDLTDVGGAEQYPQAWWDAIVASARQAIADSCVAPERGAGLLTLLALGHLTIADIPGTVTVKATYEPDRAAGEVFAALLTEFVNLYEKTKAIHKRLNGRRLQQLTAG